MMLVLASSVGIQKALTSVGDGGKEYTESGKRMTTSLQSPLKSNGDRKRKLGEERERERIFLRGEKNKILY